MIADASLPNPKKSEQYFYSRGTLGKYASVYGPTTAAREFSKQLSHIIPESTARKFRDGEAARSLSVISLPHSCSQPLMLRELDSQVKGILKLRAAGDVWSIHSCSAGYDAWHSSLACQTLLGENGS